LGKQERGRDGVGVEVCTMAPIVTAIIILCKVISDQARPCWVKIFLIY
jgi:hypothetical protein